MTENVAAGIERTWVQRRKVDSSSRFGSAWHLRSTDRAGNSGRHRWTTGADAHDYTKPDIRAAVPAPSFSVVRADLVHGERVFGRNHSTIIIGGNRVGGT